MNKLGAFLAILLLASCGGEETPDSTFGALPAAAPVTTEAPADPIDPNAGTHRYRYVEAEKYPENGCDNSREVGDELNQTVTFEDSRVTVVFIRDDLPEGVEPGLREYTEQLGPKKWRETVESTSGDGLYEHTIEFTDDGMIMTSILAGEPCFYSVRNRVDG